MKHLVLITFLALFLSTPAWPAVLPHVGVYAGTIDLTRTDFETLQPIRTKTHIRLNLNNGTTMSVTLEDLFELQLHVDLKEHHAVGTGYQPFLGELFIITLPMHFDAKTGEKMTGSFIVTRISPAGNQVIEGKFKATQLPPH